MTELSLPYGIELLKAVDDFSNQKIKNRDSLHLIFDICIVNNQFQLLEELSFTSKYIIGLARILKNASGNSDFQNIESIKRDYSENILKAAGQLEKIIALTDEPTQKKFIAQFLYPTQEALTSLRYLLGDLEWTKKYLNALKRNELE